MSKYETIRYYSNSYVEIEDNSLISTRTVQPLTFYGPEAIKAVVRGGARLQASMMLSTAG